MKLKWRCLQFLLVFPITIIIEYTARQRVDILGSISVTLWFVIFIFITENFILTNKKGEKKKDDEYKIRI